MNQDFNNGSLSENLYRYLADRNCPVSIGEICSEVYFVSYSRREVARALQELAGTNDLFRGMKNGRAYYSVNRNEGGKNIVRKNIDNLQNALNGKKSILEEEQNYDEKESLNQSAHSVSEIEILYKNGIIAKSDRYTVRIPDGFVEFKDENKNRDFAFYLPNREDKDPDNALVLILPVNDEIPMKQDFGYRLQKAYAVYYGGIFWAGPAEYYSLLFDNVRYITSEYGGYIATEVVGCRHYYFLVFCGECYKQIHLQFAGLSGTEEDFDQKALDIIKGITVDKPLKPLEHLNDDSFLPERITESCIDKWCKTLAENRRQYHLLYSTQTGVEQLRIKYENEHGCFSRIQATIRVRSYLQELCGNIDGICSEIIEFWEKLKKKTDNDELLGKAYRAIKEFRDNNDKFTIDFFDDLIKESPKGCMEVQVQVLNKDKGIIERIEAKEREEKRKKQEKERLEKEERRKQEQIKKLKEDPDIVWLEEVTRIKAKRKEALENKLLSIEENRKNKIADAASERDNAFAQCEKDLEETSKAISDMEAELSSLGLLAVGRKAKLRKSIEAAKQRAQDLASQKNSILNTYESKIAFANNKAELDSKGARRDIEKEYPLPDSPAEKERKKQAEIELNTILIKLYYDTEKCLAALQFLRIHPGIDAAHLWNYIPGFLDNDNNPYWEVMDALKRQRLVEEKTVRTTNIFDYSYTTKRPFVTKTGIQFIEKYENLWGKLEQKYPDPINLADSKISILASDIMVRENGATMDQLLDDPILKRVGKAHLTEILEAEIRNKHMVCKKGKYFG